MSEPTGVKAFGYRHELKRSLNLADLLVCGIDFIGPIPVWWIYHPPHYPFEM